MCVTCRPLFSCQSVRSIHGYARCPSRVVFIFFSTEAIARLDQLVDRCLVVWLSGCLAVWLSGCAGGFGLPAAPPAATTGAANPFAAFGGLGGMGGMGGLPGMAGNSVHVFVCLRFVFDGLIDGWIDLH